MSGEPVRVVLVDDHRMFRSGVKAELDGPTHVVIMSNGGFGGLHGKLAAALEQA